MSYFQKSNLQRENYTNTLNLLEFFIDGEESYRFNAEDEYVVTWFDKDFYTLPNNTQTAIKVRFFNLSQPVYIGKNNGQQHENRIHILIPIEMLHKVHIGSIWVNGLSHSRFKPESFTIMMEPNQDNYDIYSIAKAERDLKYADPTESILPIPFEHTKYISKLQNDKNQLIRIFSSNHSSHFIIHPLIFFITHYGYSTKINHLLSTYEWSRIEKKLLLNEIFVNDLYTEYVILPKLLTQRDSVFLYHLKYEENTYKIVKRLNNSIINSKSQASEYNSLKIQPWHNQPITLVIQGYKIGQDILCSSITSITEPQGDPINLVLPINKKRKTTSGNIKNSSQYMVIKKPYIRPKKHEYLDITRDPVNNIIIEEIIDRLIQIGEKRLLNKIYLNTNELNTCDTKILAPNSPENFGVGEMFEDGIGSTGLLQCIFELVESQEDISIDERIQKLWKHAQELQESHVITSAEWFTFEKGFNNHNNLSVISLSNLHNNLMEHGGPQKVFLMRIQSDNQTFFILEFGLQHKTDQKTTKGFSAIVYKENIDEDFLGLKLNSLSLKSPFITLLAKIIFLNGSTNEDFIDGYNLFEKKIATFIHKEGKNNNWVQNGLNKLR